MKRTEAKKGKEPFLVGSATIGIEDISLSDETTMEELAIERTPSKKRKTGLEVRFVYEFPPLGHIINLAVSLHS